MDLMDNKDCLLSCEQFCIKHRFDPKKSQFNQLCKALPIEFLFVTQNIIIHQLVYLQIAPLYIQNILLLDKNFNNCFIITCFTDNLYPGKQNNNYIHSQFDKNSVAILRTAYFSLPISSKIKELHLKVLKNIYPSGEFVRSRFNI